MLVKWRYEKVEWDNALGGFYEDTLTVRPLELVMGFADDISETKKEEFTTLASLPLCHKTRLYVGGSFK